MPLYSLLSLSFFFLISTIVDMEIILDLDLDLSMDALKGKVTRLLVKHETEKRRLGFKSLCGPYGLGGWVSYHLPLVRRRSYMEPYDIQCTSFHVMVAGPLTVKSTLLDLVGIKKICQLLSQRIFEGLKKQRKLRNRLEKLENSAQ